ncbi:MAG: hypothetical protein M3N46_01540 [Actinomycetota bacterium]|nr:hypothetical protein [Actinomycetota bacterium]
MIRRRTSMRSPDAAVARSDAAMEGAAPDPVRRHSHAVLEYFGTVVSMLAGMIVLGLIRDVVAPGVALRADLETIVMATEMVIGMSAWMVARRHARQGIAVMSAVMYLPFLLLMPLFWLGCIAGAVLSFGGHLSMLPSMALAMPLNTFIAARQQR